MRVDANDAGERQGYDVTAAEDGIKAYELAVSDRPDVIITDVNMPLADGVHLMRRVRDTPEIKRTRIIVTTCTGSTTFRWRTGPMLTNRSRLTRRGYSKRCDGFCREYEIFVIRATCLL